jgi:chromosome segregation ATPase
MQVLLKLLFISLTLTIHGCQFQDTIQSSPKTRAPPSEQKQIYRLLRQGRRYAELSEPVQQTMCKRLKKDYQTQVDWQTAWLLVYSLNTNFNCVSQKETLALIKAINTALEPEGLLLWLNKNQLRSHNEINSLQSKINKQLEKNNSLKDQLTVATKELEEVNAKIQALKAIETSINKKLDNEQAD